MDKIIHRIVLILAVAFLLVGLYNHFQFNKAINEFERLNQQYKIELEKDK